MSAAPALTRASLAALLEPGRPPERALLWVGTPDDMLPVMGVRERTASILFITGETGSQMTVHGLGRIAKGSPTTPLYVRDNESDQDLPLDVVARHTDGVVFTPKGAC